MQTRTNNYNNQINEYFFETSNYVNEESKEGFYDFQEELRNQNISRNIQLNSNFDKNNFSLPKIILNLKNLLKKKNHAKIHP
jgi:hypothetical protein